MKRKLSLLGATLAILSGSHVWGGPPVPSFDDNEPGFFAPMVADPNDPNLVQTLMVDFGNVGQVVQTGWEEASCVTTDKHVANQNCDADNTARDIATLPGHTDVTSFGTVTHSIVVSNGLIDYRNRQGSYSGGEAVYNDPDFGAVGHMIQDEIKADLTQDVCDNCTQDLVFTGLDSAPYKLTTYHHSWFGVPYDWSDFDILLEVGAGNGFETIASGLHPTHHDNPVDPTRHVSSFTSPGPDAQISFRFLPIPGSADGTGDPGSMRGRNEIPLNGFVLQVIPEPVFVPGDVNGDGVVDVADLGVLGANFNQSNMTFADGDFNDDGIVDVADLGILGANWTASQAAGNTSALVPEPTTLSLLAMSVLMVGHRRRG